MFALRTVEHRSRLKAQKHLLQIAIAIFLAVRLSSFSQASIISTTGAGTVISAPPNAQEGSVESNTSIFAWNEVQNTVLPHSITVDVSVPGTSPDSTDSNFSPLTVPAGTAINSYFLHYDVVGTPATANARQADATFTFSDPIIGLIIVNTNLDATDSYPGLSTTVYATSDQRQLELTAGDVGKDTTDQITLSADRRTLTVEFRDAGSVDDLRVITAVPEPATAALLAGFSICLLSRRRRR